MTKPSEAWATVGVRGPLFPRIRFTTTHAYYFVDAPAGRAEEMYDHPKQERGWRFEAEGQTFLVDGHHISVIGGPGLRWSGILRRGKITRSIANAMGCADYLRAVERAMRKAKAQR